MENLEKMVNAYLNGNLLNLDNIDTKLETKMIERLFAKKFRKYSIDPQVRVDVEAKLNNIIEKKLPLNFVPSFGGYKHWWTPSYPTIDWAEIFNMKFMLEYLSPICASYAGGGMFY